MGCGGTYSGSDPSIVAVGPARYAEWPCDTELLVTGPAGALVVVRQDSCPECHRNVVDLSEAGSHAVCGVPAHTCEVTIRRQ